MNQDRSIGRFWQEHNNRGTARPGTEGLHQELRQKYSGPAYKANMFNHSLENADATVKGGGLNTSRSVSTLSGETGKGVSTDELRTLYDRLMAGHRADVDPSDPEAVQASNAEFDTGVRQLKGIYYNQLKRLRDNYGTMVTQMHPEDVLRQVVENGGISTHKSKHVKYSFALDYEARKKFKYSETPITISEITRRINDLIDPEKMKKLSYKYILDWLIEIELLTVSTDSTGKKVRRPTYNGADIGIIIENRVSANGPYQVVVYNKAAQMFILDNLDAVIMQNGTK